MSLHFAQFSFVNFGLKNIKTCFARVKQIRSFCCMHAFKISNLSRQIPFTQRRGSPAAPKCLEEIAFKHKEVRKTSGNHFLTRCSHFFCYHAKAFKLFCQIQLRFIRMRVKRPTYIFFNWLSELHLALYCTLTYSNILSCTLLHSNSH